MFKVWDNVKWTSQAGGFTTNKTGVVIEVVPAGEKPRMKIKDAGGCRDHESYVVKLVSFNKGGVEKKRSGKYWPLVRHLQEGTQNCQPAAVQQTPTQPTETKMDTTEPAKKLVNHFVICLDRSGSMQGIQRQAVDTFNQNVKSIQEGATKSGQEATISLVTFGGDIQTKYLCDPVYGLQTLNYSDYRPDGQTPLFDAVARMIDKLKDRKDAGDENVSYMFIVITDGEENSSKIKGPAFLQLMSEVQKTDRWSFAFLLPPRTSQNFCRQFGIPDGNVREWEATARGMQEAARSVDVGIGSYYTSRASGCRSVKGFFMTDMSKVSVHEVRNRLVDIRSQVKIADVNRSCPIREFVERDLNLTYQTGRAFYQLMKDEKVQYHKKVILRARGDDAVYAGDEARHLLGLPDGRDVQVRPGDHANWDIFVQSTSVNRKLVPGTRLLYLQ